MEITKYNITNINNAYSLVRTCSPFKIRKGILSDKSGAEKEVYVIVLRGTTFSFDKTDPLSTFSCFRSAVAKDNLYFDLLKENILKYIPEKSNLVFIGHSLGGMVSQQLAADKDIKPKYNILKVLTIGSPYIIGRGSKCPLTRIIETADTIPALCSAALLANSFIGNPHHEINGFFMHPVKAHTEAYECGDKWKPYDCFGEKDGGRSIVIDDIPDEQVYLGE